MHQHVHRALATRSAATLLALAPGLAHLAQAADKGQLSIGHRGAPLQFPEHSCESYLAAAREGKGAIECDVTFTQDREWVCRHSQCDLHTSANILAIPDLAAKCPVPAPARSAPMAWTSSAVRWSAQAR